MRFPQMGLRQPSPMITQNIRSGSAISSRRANLPGRQAQSYCLRRASLAAVSAASRTNSEIPWFLTRAPRAISSFCSADSFISILCRLGLVAPGTSVCMGPLCMVVDPKSFGVGIRRDLWRLKHRSALLPGRVLPVELIRGVTNSLSGDERLEGLRA